MKALFILIFCTCSFVACCQDNKSTVNFGLKLGFGWSTLSPDYTDNNGYKHQFNMTGGIRAGGYLQINAGKKILFQPEVLLVVKGAQESTNNNNGYPYPPNDYPSRTTYIEIPLNLLVKLPTQSGFFTIGGGPSPAFAFNRYTSYGTAKFDMGLNFLTGYQWPLGFCVNVNFTKGFSNVSPEAAGAPRLTNSSLGLSLGYTF